MVLLQVSSSWWFSYPRIGDSQPGTEHRKLPVISAEITEIIYILMLVTVTAMLFVYLYGKCAGGGLRPFGATGAQKGASADVKEKMYFHLNKSTLTTHSS